MWPINKYFIIIFMILESKSHWFATQTGQYSWKFLSSIRDVHCNLWLWQSKAIFKSNQKRLIFTHSPSFFSLIFFHLKNLGPDTEHTPLHTFSIFGPQLSDVGSNLLVNFSKVLKYVCAGFQVRWAWFQNEIIPPMLS